MNVRDLEREEEMARLFLNGKSFKEIGEQFGLSRERVRQIFARRGIKGRSSGLGTVEVGCCVCGKIMKRKAWYQRWADKEGKRPYCQKCYRRWPQISEAKVANILALWDEGVAIHTIVKRLGCGPSTVYRIAHKHRDHPLPPHLATGPIDPMAG